MTDHTHQERTLRSIEEHDEMLRSFFDTAREEVIVESPRVTTGALRACGILNNIHAAIERGVKVKVYADSERTNTTRDVLQQLCVAGCFVATISKTHSKVVFREDDLMCIGSFNWLSASRKAETAERNLSIIYTHNIGEEKEVELKSLDGCKVNEWKR